MQLRIRGISHVLFLHGGVDESRVVMVIVVIVIIFLIDTNTFCQDKLHTTLTDTLTEMNKLARIAWIRWRKLRHAAKVLVISILAPLLNNGLIGKIPYVL